MRDSRISPVSASDELVRTLIELKLCRPHDFRRAVGIVRTLARDLPPFDSVWIDALVQLKCLTSYQARRLESGAASELRVGAYVVLDELGRGPRGTTLLAKTLGRNDRCVVKRLRIAPEDRSDCRRRLSQLLERTAAWSHPYLVVPQLILDDTSSSGTVYAVSRFVAGIPLSDLLVRRGRFPAQVVIEVARQLLEGLSALDSRGLVHGDIRLSNVRLSDQGSAVLVDGGIRPALCPELTIHESFALDSLDGVAPELIGTGNAPTASTELYALGCLLWQLLAGRPPYPTADPLMKLASHQTRRIEDVRTWAPDTPAFFAQSLMSMTSPVASERPRSFDELLQRWGRPGLRSRSHLRHYRRTFDGAVPHLNQSSSPVTEGRWPWVAASLFVAAGAAMTLADRGLRNDLLALSHRVAEIIRSPQSNNAERTAGSTTPVAASANGLLPLPPPSASGEIVLAEAGPYDVANLATSGSLTIRGAEGVNPVIRVGRDPLRIAAESLSLVNVSVRRSVKDSDAVPPALMLVRAQSVSIDRCEFALGKSDDRRENGMATAAALAWLPLTERSSTGVDKDRGRFEIANTMFRGSGPALLFADSPSEVSVNNSLKSGSGPCFVLGSKARLGSVSFRLSQVTLRDTGALLRFGGAFAEQSNAPPIVFAAENSVFALHDDTPSLVEVQSARLRSDIAKSVQMTGAGSIITPGRGLMTHSESGHAGGAGSLIDADEQFEGLIVSDLEFIASTDTSATDSELKQMTAPRSSSKLPGIEASRFPKFPAD